MDSHTHTDDLCRINFKKPGVLRPVASKHLVLKIKDSLAWEQLELYTITNDDKIIGLTYFYYVSLICFITG